MYVDTVSQPRSSFNTTSVQCFSYAGQTPNVKADKLFDEISIDVVSGILPGMPQCGRKTENCGTYTLTGRARGEGGGGGGEGSLAVD